MEGDKASRVFAGDERETDDLKRRRRQRASILSMRLTKRRSGRTRTRALGRLPLLTVALVAAASWAPVRARVKAVAVLADALGLRFPRPFAPALTRQQVELDGVSGDLYTPRRPAPAVVLVPGAAPGGKDDARAVRLARALGKAERVVFVPALELADRRLVEADVERLVASAQGVARHSETVGLPSFLGFSYGGSLALIAAADSRLHDVLQQVAVFGAYFDLVGVVQAVTCGTSLVDERVIPWDPHPRANEVLREIALRLVAPRAREKLRGALEGSVEPASLPPEVRAYYDLLTNDDPRRTYALAERLAPHDRALLRTFSPSSVASRIRAPVVAVHSTDDPIVPYGELIRLRQHLPEAKTARVSLFTHVDFASGVPMNWVGAAVDAWSLWRFTSWLLSGQE